MDYKEEEEEAEEAFLYCGDKGLAQLHTTVRLDFSLEGGEVKKRNTAIKVTIS